MGNNAVLVDIKEELLSPNCNVISILRKSYYYALKNQDVEFSKWITNELNGYPYDNDIIPEYRSVRGKVKAKNPYLGYIPVIFENDGIENDLSARKVPTSIPELLSYLSDASMDVFMKYPADVQKILNETLTPTAHFEYFLHIPKSALINIIETIKIKLLEWIAPQLNDTNNDYIYSKQIDSLTINGSNNVVNLQSGQNIVVGINCFKNDNLVGGIKDAMEKDVISEEDKNELIELVDSLKIAINNNKKQSVVKSILVGIKDFAISVGASLTAAFIQNKIGF